MTIESYGLNCRPVSVWWFPEAGCTAQTTRYTRCEWPLTTSSSSVTMTSFQARLYRPLVSVQPMDTRSASAYTNNNYYYIYKAHWSHHKKRNSSRQLQTIKKNNNVKSTMYITVQNCTFRLNNRTRGKIQTCTHARTHTHTHNCSKLQRWGIMDKV